ncbi:hypothetical protein [Methylobacterium persicinum]|uniref:hypothetical protein n=1 Tax=Methylobacterium persicinum TaxID=374426 RepID=UPI001EE1BFEB|nr:hypothetical protein [Methylobacterium persicinum]GJE36319.1 hypothetical protein KHHGKMAE_0367 [Methylobacterium persicinum]
MAAEWEQSGRTVATLPATGDGKVNVRALVAAFKDWAEERGVAVPGSAWQYVYAERAWADEINAVAASQGLKPVGSRRSGSTTDDPVQARLDRMGREAKAQAEGHAQSKVRLAHLERELAEQKAENARLRERFAFMQRTGMVLRVGDDAEC